MEVFCILFFILAMSAGMAHASNIWMSASDVDSPLGEVPLIETAAGRTDQTIYIWARPAQGKTLLNWSLDLRSTDSDVIAFQDVQVFNPVLAEPEGAQMKRVFRYEHMNDPVIDPSLIRGVNSFSVAHIDRIGAGIGPVSLPIDPLYDPVNDAWLLGAASYNVVGPGRTDLYLQIGGAGIQNQDELSSDHNVVFGNTNDSPLNGHDNRQTDSTTPEATIVAHPVLWHEQARIIADDGGFSDFLGSMGMSDDRIVVGAGNSDTAYISERSGSHWNQVDKVTAGNAESPIGFGTSVGISGDRIVVGADEYDGDSSLNDHSGAAYVFEDSGPTWTEAAELIPSDLTVGDEFGASVAMFGDRVVVGAYQDDDNGDNSGSAYIFEQSQTGWTEVAKLTASDAAAGDRFGNSVAISGDRIVVGANSDGAHVGSAYVFQRYGSNWVEVTKLVAHDAMPDDYLGTSVATSGDLVAISSPAGTRFQDFRHVSVAGSVYVFVDPADIGARLVTGSPVSLSQTVDTPAENFDLTFEYQYLTITGELDVLLDGVSLGTIEAPTTLQDDFATVSLSVGVALLDQDGIDLKFVLDGPTGSTLLINDIEFPTLINGDFQTGDLTGWTATVSANGFIEAVELTTIPEPSTGFLATIGLLGLVGYRRVRKPKRRYSRSRGLTMSLERPK